MATSEVTKADQLLLYREPGRHELVRGELRSMSAAGWWHDGGRMYQDFMRSPDACNTITGAG